MKNIILIFCLFFSFPAYSSSPPPFTNYHSFDASTSYISLTHINNLITDTWSDWALVSDQERVGVYAFTRVLKTNDQKLKVQWKFENITINNFMYKINNKLYSICTDLDYCYTFRDEDSYFMIKNNSELGFEPFIFDLSSFVKQNNYFMDFTEVYLGDPDLIIQTIKLNN